MKSRTKHPEDYDFDCRFGAAIRALRLARGLSQENLAESCDVSFQQIGKYEKGKNAVAFKHFPKLAAALGITTSVLINEAMKILADRAQPKRAA